MSVLRGLCWRRVFCQLLRPDLDRVLAQQPPAKGPLLDLFYAVHHLERKALKFFPSALGTRSLPLFRCFSMSSFVAQTSSLSTDYIKCPRCAVPPRAQCGPLVPLGTTESCRIESLLDSLLGSGCW